MNKKTIISSLLLATSMIGCSSGNSSSSNSNAPSSQAPSGPIGYEQLKAKFNASSMQLNKNSLNATGTSCGSIMNRGSYGGSIASGFINLIPVAGPLLGAIFQGGATTIGVIGSGEGSACIEQEFQNIENQLTIQQSQINDITNSLDLSSNSIWSDITGIANNIAYINYNNFTSNISRISGKSGAFNQVYAAGGFLYDGQLTSLDLNALISESQAVNLNNMALAYDNLSSVDIPSILTNIAGAQYTTPCPIDENGSFTCYNNVTSDSNSQLTVLLQATNNYLQNKLTSSLSANQNQNIVPILDDYNNTLVVYYQQSLSAIQEAYHLAYLANYLNYSSKQSKFNDIYLVPGTYFSYQSNMSESANTSAYNNAQLQLSLMTAALINQLYLNITGYIVTDVPVGNQSYPIYTIKESIGGYTYTESIEYKKFIGTKLKNNGMNFTATQYLETALANAEIGQASSYNSLVTNLQNIGAYNSTTGASPNLFFYQYNGLRDAESCIATLHRYNDSNGLSGTIQQAFSSGNSCPSLLLDANGKPVTQSILSMDTIQPYYTKGLPTLSGNVRNNVNQQACNGNSVGNIPAWNMYYYNPNPNSGFINGPYLMCGNWQTTGITDQGSTPGTVFTMTNGYTSSVYPYMLNTTTLNGGTNIYLNEQTYVTAVGYSPVWSSLTGPNAYKPVVPGTYYPVIQSGWINDNMPSNNDMPSDSLNDVLYHSMALQTSLPDGFIAPYAVSMSFMQNLEWGNTDAAYEGYTIGVSPNPNVIKAGVTIEGSGIYNAINFNNVPYSSIVDLAQNYPWSPVTSTNKSIPSQVSTLEVNGYLITMVGNLADDPKVKAAPIQLCISSASNTSATIYTESMFISNNGKNYIGNGVDAIVIDNCLEGFYSPNANTYPGSRLPAGASFLSTGVNNIMSNNGSNMLVLQSDGNLVLYTLGNAKWSSGTAGSGSNNSLIMQGDGNLVLYSSSGKVLWASGTKGSGNYLQIQDDGNLVIYNSSNTALWATNTN